MEQSTGGGGLDDRTFDDYDPAVEWSHAAGADIVTISLPGFKKEELKVLVDSHRNLQVRGQRPAAAGGGSGWIRFRKLLKLPDDCDIEGIRSKFANETLIVTLPKNTSCASPPDHGSAPEPAAPTMPEKDEEDKGEEEGEEEQEEEEGEEGAGGKEPGKSRPIRWLVATVAAVLFVGVAGYVVWRKLRSGSAAGTGDRGTGELAGAGILYVNEM